MPKINKNTDLKPLKEYFIGKGELELRIFPLSDFKIPKEGCPVGSNLEIYHWIPLHKATPFNVECRPDPKCPICEMLKPKTRWQKLKIRISKLWKLLFR